jgi:hypothetical protein
VCVAPARPDIVATHTRQLAAWRGLGVNGALTLTTELFAWRGFTNGRDVGASVGLTPTPYRSDQRVVEQGISRSGNRRGRALKHSAGVELGPLAADQRPHPLVPGALRRARTRAPDRDCRRRAQTDDCARALCGNRHRARGRGPEGIVVRHRPARCHRALARAARPTGGFLGKPAFKDGAARPCNRRTSMDVCRMRCWRL